MNTRRVLIAHNQEVVSQLLIEVIRSTPGKRAIDCTSNGNEAIKIFYDSRKPESKPYDLVILDPELSELNGIDVLLVMLRCDPKANILICWSNKKDEIQKKIFNRQEENKEICGVNIKNVDTRKLKYLHQKKYESQIRKEINIPETEVIEAPYNTPEVTDEFLDSSPATPSPLLLSNTPSQPRLEIKHEVIDVKAVPASEIKIINVSHQPIQHSIQPRPASHSKGFRQPIQHSVGPGKIGHFAPPPPPPRNITSAKSKRRCCF